MNESADLTTLLTRTTRLLQQQISMLEAGGDVTQQDEWQRYFGKESVVGVLGKLVAMHKQMRDQHDDAPDDDADALAKPMTHADWELLERCVNRWKTATKAD